jgi:hypothetical protein
MASRIYEKLKVDEPEIEQVEAPETEQAKAPEVEQAKSARSRTGARA